MGVRNSTHCGALFYFPMRALPHGMIGYMTSNAAPTMPPYGGTTRCLCTNPHCWAIPAGKEPGVLLVPEAVRGGVRHRGALRGRFFR